MLFQSILPLAVFTGLVQSQTLAIPNRVGAVTALPSPSSISGTKDMGNREYDRGHACDSDLDTGSSNAVFILEDGATLSNVIIGAKALEGVHCKGSCTLKNVWFRDVCEDAITVLKTSNGPVLISGGGAQEAVDKVVQHNGRGTVTIENYTVVNVGKLFRSCGDCTGNGGPRNVVVKNVKANGVKADLVGINSNYGDKADVSGVCGKGISKICQTFTGVEKGKGTSTKNTDSGACRGQSTYSACA